MDSVAADQAKGSVAPPEPISPARSAITAPTSASASTSAPAPASASASLPAKPPTPAPTTASTATAPRSNPGSKSPPPPSPPTASAPVVDRAPSPARNPPAATETAKAKASPAIAPATVPESTKESVIPRTEPTPPKQLNGNGHKNGIEDGEAESELSEPDSTVHSPSGVEFNELEDEIIVSSRANGARKSSPVRIVSDREDEVMADPDGPATSHYPKRKRTSLFNDLSESKIEIPTAVTDEKVPPAAILKSKPPRQSLSSVKGVIVGYWRDSPAPNEKQKHAVIGFIDVRDRLRTRIQPITTSGDPIPSEYPLPPGPGGSWVTFERIVFSDHLIGLDHIQIKEYVRIRANASEETEAAQKAAEKEAVKDAVRRAQENATVDPNAPANNYVPVIAYGLEIPEGGYTPNRSDTKRRKVSGGFATINPAPSNGVSQEQPPPPTSTLPSHTARSPIDPLLGTRPTRILLGYWKHSSEADVKDRHAVYGILGQNDMFRVKLVRETRDGRFVDGNFPMGAGALWISYEEVEFESHLKPLTRVEIKEYCRVRQWQIDHGESNEERISNETKAVYEAQARVGTGYKTLSPASASFPNITPDDAEVVDTTATRPHELRQSRRVESRSERPLRQAPPAEAEPRPVVNNNRGQGPDPLQRTGALARREIERAEAAQGRADRLADNRERAAAAARNAAAAAADAAAAAAPAPATNGRARFHESEEMQRLNKVWARQESLRMKNGAEDAKIYGGIKYERKANGPFMGKLVSQGTIISIDGEDFVEYRVLTKPSFF
ncbi:Fc.00g003000.m01.CDS01 [Cosmosporella sp. VM-42]